jgi:hypothetical protein
VAFAIVLQVGDAVKKAYQRACRNLYPVPRYNGHTIPEPTKAKYGQVGARLAGCKRRPGGGPAFCNAVPYSGHLSCPTEVPSGQPCPAALGAGVKLEPPPDVRVFVFSRVRSLLRRYCPLYLLRSR